jgi:NAD(P)H-dependent FMN reductase
MTRIAIIAGSTRPGRKARTVADWVQAIAAEREDAEFTVIDLAEIALPHLDEPVPASAGRYQHAHTRDWAGTVAGFDGFVFVTPEYNHSTSAALKNALDFVYAEWNNKAAGFVSYGATGGIRAVEQLRLIMAELQIADVRAQVALSLFSDFTDMTELTPAPYQAGFVHTMLDQVVAWAQMLRPLRAEATPVAS